MTILTRYILLFAVCTSLFSCTKKSDLTEREKQEEQERTELLMFNEILEQEGVKFVLNYDQSLVKLNLKLYKGTGTNLTPLELTAVQPNVNYAISVSSMPENSDYTLLVEFANVTSGGSFSVSVVGFTDINASKTFVIADNAFTTGSGGTAKAYLRIKKGITKFSFYKI